MNKISNINQNNTIKIIPSNVSGCITIPSSKSILHRAIVCASLAKGTSKLTNVYLSKDIMCTINVFRNLGANIEILDSSLIIEGIKDYKSVRSTELYCGESGSTLRFIIPILTLFDYEFKIYCEEGLINRPLGVYEELFKNNTSKFIVEEEEKDGKTVHYIIVKGKLNNKVYDIDGSISSQFVSGMLFVLPLLNKNTLLKVNDLKSKGYVFLTLSVMSAFGITIGYSQEFNITGNMEYKSINYNIEGDFTQFANFIVLGTINNKISCNGIDPITLQGDSVLINKFDNVRFLEDYTFSVNKCEYNDLVFNINDNPDLGPILMVLLATTGGKLENVQRLKYKESNRIQSMMEELKKFDINVRLINDNIYIDKVDEIVCHEELDSHNDHRIFMAMAILSTISKNEVIIHGANSIDKSYPTFIDDLRKLGVNIQ